MYANTQQFNAPMKQQQPPAVAPVMGARAFLEAQVKLNNMSEMKSALDTQALAKTFGTDVVKESVDTLMEHRANFKITHEVNVTGSLSDFAAHPENLKWKVKGRGKGIEKGKNKELILTRVSAVQTQNTTGLNMAVKLKGIESTSLWVTGAHTDAQINLKPHMISPINTNWEIYKRPGKIDVSSLKGWDRISESDIDALVKERMPEQGLMRIAHPSVITSIIASKLPNLSQEFFSIGKYASEDGKPVFMAIVNAEIGEKALEGAKKFRRQLAFSNPEEFEAEFVRADGLPMDSLQLEQNIAGFGALQQDMALNKIHNIGVTVELEYAVWDAEKATY